MTDNQGRQSRREFLKSTAWLTSAVVAAPFILTGSTSQAAESKNEKLNVACIGVGSRGSNVGHAAGNLGNMVACCDVDRGHAEKFAARYEGGCAIYSDYRKLLERKDIDAVVIGTPDHWHTVIAIAAMQSGRDVYCEKPLTLTIDEGKLICKVVKKTGRVFQVGTQQRSDNKFLNAIALARSGRLGENLSATCSIGGAPSGGPFDVATTPADLDWDVWLGQSPKVEYTPQRCHGQFRWWLEYSGGKLTDWGAHHVDIAQWGLGFENSGPVEIEGAGNFPNIPDNFDPVAFFAGKQKIVNGYNAATKFNVKLTFDTGATITVREGPGNGIWFKGEKGEIFVNRGKLNGPIIDELTDDDHQWLKTERTKLYKGMPQRSHMENFFACVKERKEPVSDVFSHHRHLTSCHLSNIAMLLKRKLRWDPKNEVFVADKQANALLSRPRRKGYEIQA
ncbi:MAG: Gfo/Idh/MocA family oxidoreductase [Pedosphaera sp.]|nr:Gfo/Idh/MocA family oxidoreductase [Pedosphaera sp.]